MRAPVVIPGAVLAIAALAAADPKPRAVDIKPFRDKLVVLEDADGGVYAVMHEPDQPPRIFYGTGAVLYEQLLAGSRSRNGDGWSVAVDDPRGEYPFMSHIERRQDGSYRKHCGSKLVVELTQRTGDRAKQVLDKRSFLTSPVTRRPHLLARDTKGVYYYVDALRDAYGGNGHRVFVGKRGAMKLMALTDVANDTSGEVYSTKTGDLRFVRIVEDGRKPEVKWIRGERVTELIALDVYMNQPLIFRDLGIYKISGTLCGNL
jgi:hypothetical protein